MDDTVSIAGMIIGVLAIIYILTRKTYSGRKKVAYTLMFAMVSGGFYHVYKAESAQAYRERLLSIPSFRALNQLEPELFDKAYTLISSLNKQGDIDNVMASPEMAEFYDKINRRMAERLPELLYNAPDEAVLMYARTQNDYMEKILELDKSGELCFNMLYPGVVAQPDLSKLKTLIDNNRNLARLNWLNLVADAAARNEKPSHLPAAEIEKAYARVWNEGVEPYGEGFMDEPDIRLYSGRPRDVCEANIAVNKAALALKPHLAAEVFRYMFSG